MTEPKWRKTTIQELIDRVARGEWPRFRALSSDDGEWLRGRLLGDFCMIKDLDHLGLPVPGARPESIDLRAYADLEIWTVDKSTSVKVGLVHLGSHIEDTDPDRLMDAFKLIAERPSHRAYTLTDRTLQLARDTARAASGAGDRGDACELGDALTRALEHAQGMPEADLRRLATWVRERCSDLELVQIADAALAHLAVDAMPVGSVQVRGEPERKAGTLWADLLVNALRRQPPGIVVNPLLPPEAQAARLLDDYSAGMKTLRDGMTRACERAETYERERDDARGRVAGLEHALDKATEAAQNWKSCFDDAEVELRSMRPLHQGMRAALAMVESIVTGSGQPPVNLPEVERAVSAVREYERTTMLALRRIEAISNGLAPSSVSEMPEVMPLEVADALVSRLLSQFVEFGKVSDALAKARTRIAQLELEAEGAAKDRALVSATETLVRRMVDRLVETDPEWIDGLRKGGS